MCLYTYTYTHTHISLYVCACIYMYIELYCSVSVRSDSLRPHELQHTMPPSPSPSPKVCPTYLCISAAKSLQSCPTLCDPIDGSPPGSPIPGILKARTLEWVAISSSSAWKWKVKVKSLNHVWVIVTRWTAAYQAPPSMGFSRQEYWSGVPYKHIQIYIYIYIYTYTHSMRECVCLRAQQW